MLAWALVIGQLCFIPMLADHRGPLTVFASYSLLLSTCTLIAVSQYLNGSKSQNEEGLLYRAIGFFLFYISDSVLMLSHTGYWKLAPSFCVLSTYYSAQYFILFGNTMAVNPVKKSVKINWWSLTSEPVHILFTVYFSLFPIFWKYFLQLWLDYLMSEALIWNI